LYAFVHEPVLPTQRTFRTAPIALLELRQPTPIAIDLRQATRRYWRHVLPVTTRATLHQHLTCMTLAQVMGTDVLE
jgi:hypothetical protein